MDPFHVFHLAGDALENCRCRIQLDAFGRRGRKDDLLYRTRRTFLTGVGRLTEKQKTRLEDLFIDDQHAQVDATWGVYQDLITANREPDRGLARLFLKDVIEKISTGVPASLIEVRKLGRTLK